MKYNDYPFYECSRAADKLIEEGHEVHQKFTCDGCGQRLTIEEPNVFHKLGACDKCNAITNIEYKGCNYLVISKVQRRR